MKNDNMSNSCFSVSDICKIIKECRKNKVSEFAFGEIKFKISPSGSDFLNRDLGVQRSGAETEPLDTVKLIPQTHSPYNYDRPTFASQSMDESPLVESQPPVEEVKEAVEKILDDERQLNLITEDPLEWQESQLKEMDSAEIEHRGAIPEVS